jgi:hypothetical protein
MLLERENVLEQSKLAKQLRNQQNRQRKLPKSIKIGEENCQFLMPK